MEMDNGWANLTDKTKSISAKIRVMRVYKLPHQGMTDISAEVKQLTDKDLEDFARWFTEAGYPTTHTPTA